MPNIEMVLVDGDDDGQQAALIAALTQATVDAIGAPADSVRVWLTALPATQLGIGGKSLAAGEAGAATMAIIQVTFIAGRSDPQKRALIAALTDAAVDVTGIERADVRVILKDIPNTDYGIAGQTARSLGRGVDRHRRPAEPG